MNWYVLRADLYEVKLFLIDGTDSNSFPPFNLIQSWVLPEFLSPIKARTFWLPVFFFPSKKYMIIANTTAPMINGNNPKPDEPSTVYNNVDVMFCIYYATVEFVTT